MARTGIKRMHLAGGQRIKLTQWISKRAVEDFDFKTYDQIALEAEADLKFPIKGTHVFSILKALEITPTKMPRKSTRSKANLTGANMLAFAIIHLYKNLGMELPKFLTMLTNRIYRLDEIEDMLRDFVYAHEHLKKYVG